MMRSASRRALQQLREERERIVGEGVDADTLTTLAEELYAVGNLLAGQPRLRRTLGDPATAPESRAEFVQQLFGSRLSDQALALVRAAVDQRWSSPWDLSDAIEGTGDDALFVAAEQDGSLDQVEDELFRFERILENDGELSALLDEYTVAAERRISLLDSLLENKVTRTSLTMLRHAVSSERKRSLVLAVDDLLETAAALQERSDRAGGLGPAAHRCAAGATGRDALGHVQPAYQCPHGRRPRHPRRPDRPRRGRDHRRQHRHPARQGPQRPRRLSRPTLHHHDDESYAD